MAKLEVLDVYDEHGPAYRENPRYRRIERGPSCFFLDIKTGALYERVGADHINKKITAGQVKDKGLIRIVLGD